MKIIEYIKETRAEMKHVAWPSRAQSISYSVIVLIGSVLAGLLLGAFDSFFITIVEKIIN